MEVSKTTADRLKDENAVLVKQNKKLVEEMQEMVNESEKVIEQKTKELLIAQSKGEQ